MFVHSMDVKTAILVHVWIPFRKQGMERKEQARIYRKLYGYRSSSNYGRYHYDVKGLLDTIPSIRYEDGNFLIPSSKKRKITEFLEKNNASYRMWRVIPDESEMEKLKST